MIFKAIAKHVGKKVLKGAKNMMTPTINSMKKIASKKSTGISFKPKPNPSGPSNTAQKYSYLYKTSKHRNKAADAYDKATPGWWEKTYGKKTPAQRKASTNFVQTESKILNESNRIMSGGRKVVGGKKKYVAGESGAVDGSSFSIKKPSKGGQIEHNYGKMVQSRKKNKSLKYSEKEPNFKNFTMPKGKSKLKPKGFKLKKSSSGYALPNLKGGQLINVGKKGKK